jgi:hypothetical protein
LAASLLLRRLREVRGRALDGDVARIARIELAKRVERRDALRERSW